MIFKKKVSKFSPQRKLQPQMLSQEFQPHKISKNREKGHSLTYSYQARRTLVPKPDKESPHIFIYFINQFKTIYRILWNAYKTV